MLPILRRDAQLKTVDTPKGPACEITAFGMQAPVRVSSRVLHALQALEQHADLDAWVASVSRSYPDLSAEQLNRVLDMMRNANLLEPRNDPGVSSGLDALFPDTPAAETNDPFKKRSVTSSFQAIGALPPDARKADPPRARMQDNFAAAVAAFEAGDLHRAEALFALMQGTGDRDAEVNDYLARIAKRRALPSLEEDQTAVLQVVSFENAPFQEAPHTIGDPDAIPVEEPEEPAAAVAADAPSPSAEEEEPEGEDAANVDASGQVERARADPAAVRRRWARRLRRLAVVASVIGGVVAAGALITVPFSITYEAEVFPIERGLIRAPADGVIAKITVEEGARVEKGQVLGTMGDSDQRLSVVKSFAAVEKARAELELLRAGTRPEEVARAEAAVAGLAREVGIASSRVTRLKGLVNQGVAPRDELERAQAEAAALNGQLAQARANAKLLKAGSRPDEIKKKEAELRSLEAQLEVDEKLLDAMSLKAPMQGIITTRRPQDLQSTKVQLGDPVLEIARLDQMRVEILVNERDFDVLQKSLPISLKIAAYPTEQFDGEVTRVAQQVEKIPTGNIVRVEGHVDNSAGRLVPNMSGYAEVRVGEKPVLSLLMRRAVRYMRVRFFL